MSTDMDISPFDSQDSEGYGVGLSDSDASDEEADDGASGTVSLESAGDSGDGDSQEILDKPTDIGEELASCLKVVFEHHIVSDEPHEEWLERKGIPKAAALMLEQQELWSTAQVEKGQTGGSQNSGREVEFATMSVDDELDTPSLSVPFTALGFLTMEWRVRRSAVKLTSSKTSERLFTFLVVLSAFCLVLDVNDPSRDPSEPDWLWAADWREAEGSFGGCTYASAQNYKRGQFLTYDDGSCEFGGSGCMDKRATNYNFCATESDQAACIFGGTCMSAGHAKRFARGSCSSNNKRVVDGVLDRLLPDGSQTICHTEDHYHTGCMSRDSSNYDPLATSQPPGACGTCSVGGGVDDDDWIRSREECLRAGRVSASVLNEFLNWYLLLAFTFEVGLKITAYGLFRGPNTYLMVGWNLLDLGVVLTSWIPFIFGATAGTTVWRTFRLLRPLRTIQRFPGLRRLVETIVTALPQLGSLVSLFALLFTTFCVIGVQLWSGRWKQRCFTQQGFITPELCDIDEQNATGVSVGLDAGCLAETDVCDYGSHNPFEVINGTDFISFDSVPSSLMIVFHLVTLSSWSEMMHITQITSGYWSCLYFVSAVVMGGYLMMTLFVCILKENFDVADAVQQQGAAAFLKIDLDGSGELDQAEIGKVFLTHGLYLTDEQFEGVFTFMDTDGNGAIQIDEFLAFLAGGSDVAIKLRKKMAVGGVMDDGADDDVLDESGVIASAKHKLTQLAMLREDANVDWNVLFDYYDTDGNRELDEREFRMALRRDAHISTKHMSDDDVSDLFKAVDTDGGGTVDVEEFDAWMQEGVEKLAPINEQTRVAVEAAIVRISCKALHIERQGESEAVDQVKSALKKAGAPAIVEDFALGESFSRELYVNYQPKLWPRAPGGFRDGKHAGHSGTRLVTVTSELIEPLIGHSLRFQCSENLVEIVGEYTQRPVDAVQSAINYYEEVSLGSLRTTIRKNVIFKVRTQATPATTWSSGAFLMNCLLFQSPGLTGSS